MKSAMTAITKWPGAVDEILGGDQVVVLAHVTPARGVVLTPLTNTGLREREAGTMTPVSSSIGMWRKLKRIKQNPHVAIAYHTREHGFSDRPEYVLVQGLASLTRVADRSWVERNLENWERFSGPRDVGPIGERWLRAYHWRVGVEIAVERVVVWPDLGCHGASEVHGAPLASEPPAAQRLPRNGTAPRIDHARAARRAARRRNVLLGWVGADGFPMAVPVGVPGAEQRGMVLELPEGVAMPSGGRRAGLVAHSFARYTFGQHQHKHTGWLVANAHERRAIYAPHTESGYWLPESRFLYRIASGFVTRRGLRAARRTGFVP
jgi:hypothetical protein